MQKLSSQTLALLVGLGIASAHAAPVTFGPDTVISGDSDVINQNVDYAYSLNGPTTTVNGVTFTGAGTSGTSNFSLADANGVTPYNGYGGGNSTPFSGLSSGYQSILSNGVYSDGGAVNNTNTLTLTLDNLTPGVTYEVESFVNDSRVCCGNNGREETISAPDGGSGSATFGPYNNSGGAQGGVGDYIVGTFVADATGTQAVTFTGGNVQLNAFEVAGAVPEPSTWVAAGGLLLLAAGDFRRRLKA